MNRKKSASPFKYCKEYAERDYIRPTIELKKAIKALSAFLAIFIR